MLFSGYLKAVDVRPVEDSEDWEADLVIPNREVRSIFRTTISNWFNNSIGSDIIYLKKSLLEGDVDTFEEIIFDFSEKTFSYFDVSGKYPEKFYHGFVLGMIAHLSDVFEIKSNRESGKGRYDVILIPKDKSKFGTVFEFKVKGRKETLQSAIKKAKQQITAKNYRAELESAGVKNIQEIAIAFEGKNIKLEKI